MFSEPHPRRPQRSKRPLAGVCRLIMGVIHHRGRLLLLLVTHEAMSLRMAPAPVRPTALRTTAPQLSSAAWIVYPSVATPTVAVQALEMCGISLKVAWRLAGVAAAALAIFRAFIALVAVGALPKVLSRFARQEEDYMHGKIRLDKANLFKRAHAYHQREQLGDDWSLSQVLVRMLNSHKYVLAPSMVRSNAGEVRGEAAEAYFRLARGEPATEAAIRTILHHAHAGPTDGKSAAAAAESAASAEPTTGVAEPAAKTKAVEHERPTTTLLGEAAAGAMALELALETALVSEQVLVGKEAAPVDEPGLIAEIDRDPVSYNAEIDREIVAEIDTEINAEIEAEIDALRAALAERGLSIEGKKNELQERLLEALDAQPAALETALETALDAQPATPPPASAAPASVLVGAEPARIATVAHQDAESSDGGARARAPSAVDADPNKEADPNEEADPNKEADLNEEADPNKDALAAAATSVPSAAELARVVTAAELATELAYLRAACEAARAEAAEAQLQAAEAQLQAATREEGMAALETALRETQSEAARAARAAQAAEVHALELDEELTAAHAALETAREAAATSEDRVVALVAEERHQLMRDADAAVAAQRQAAEAAAAEAARAREEVARLERQLTKLQTAPAMGGWWESAVLGASGTSQRGGGGSYGGGGGGSSYAGAATLLPSERRELERAFQAKLASVEHELAETRAQLEASQAQLQASQARAEEQRDAAEAAARERAEEQRDQRDREATVAAHAAAPAAAHKRMVSFEGVDVSPAIREVLAGLDLAAPTMDVPTTTAVPTARPASAGAPPNLTAANRAPATHPKYPKYSSAQIEEMTVRQLKRALEERGEGFDLAWVGRPDERQLLQEHATSLRTMCTDASFGPDADSVDEFARFRDLQAISEPDAGSLESWGGHPRRFREPHRSTSASDVPPSAPGHRVAGSPQGPGQRPGSPQGQPGPSGQPLFGPSGQPARPASTAVPPSGPAQVPRPASTAVPPSAPAYRDSAPAYREGLQVHVHDHPPDGTFEKIKRRLEQESMARMQGRPAHFINPAHVWSENGPNRLP